MPTYQYRIAGEFGMSNSGSAILALVNKAGSNKRVTIRSVELTARNVLDNGTAGTVTSTLPVRLAMATGGTVSGGNPVPLAKMDTDATWPATVVVAAGAAVTGVPTPIGGVTIAKQMNGAATAGNWFLSQQSGISRFGGVKRGPRQRASGPVEQVTVRQGENFTLRAITQPQNPVPVRVQATLIAGTRTFTVNYLTVLAVTDTAVFAVMNSAGSGQVIKVLDMSVTELGTQDSPYFQLVPIGTMDALSAVDPVANVSVLKMDTNYPDPSTWLMVKTDAPILPFGLPENALSDASAGSPKGSNYLKAKDFIGPQYRVVFPEYSSHSTVRLPESLGHTGHRHSDIGVIKAGITLRESEGIALVSAAETAAITTAVAMSGWQSWHFAMQVEVAPLRTPTLTLTGLQNPSEVRIFIAGTTTLLTGQEDVTTGTFTWQYDPDTVTAVDISILSLGFLNMRITGQTLGTTDVTIPIQQSLDRQYQNA